MDLIEPYIMTVDGIVDLFFTVANKLHMVKPIVCGVNNLIIFQKI